MLRFTNDLFQFEKTFKLVLQEKFKLVNFGVRFIDSKNPSRLADSELSPFSTNPLASYNNQYDIVYNKEIIEQLNLTNEEIWACIAHEIGHLINQKDNFQELYDYEIEEICDKTTFEFGLQLDLLTTLLKFKDYFHNNTFDSRLNSLYQSIFLYRPEWTCGKYNAVSHTAIVYNLIEGQAYYFNEESAIVVGNLLLYQRNKAINLLTFKNNININIEVEEIIEFIKNLKNLGLITSHIYTEEEITNYRLEILNINKNNILNFWDSSFINTSSDNEFINAEDEYALSVKGWSNVVFEMTYRCSEKCIHCYNIGSTHYENDIDRRGDRNELTLEEFISVIDQLVEQGLFKVCITGGDPFSKSIIWEVLEYLYSKEIAVEIYTNGIAIVNQVDKLAKLYPRIIGMTLYSGEEEVHDKITRTKGSFKKTISTFHNLSNLAIPLQLKCCVFKTNIDTYRQVYELAKEFCAIPQIEINIRNSIDGNRYVSEHLRLNDEEYENLFADPYILPHIDSSSLDKITKRDFNANACKSGINSCTLTPEGNIIPCPAFHLILGNVRENTIIEIRNSELLKKWKHTKLSEYETCGTLPYCDFCSICAGENYADTGNALKASENKCFMARKRYKYAQKIYCKKDKPDVLN